MVVLSLFCFGWKFPMKMAKMSHFWKLDASPPRRKSAFLGEALHLGELEAPKLLVSTSPQ